MRPSTIKGFDSVVWSLIFFLISNIINLLSIFAVLAFLSVIVRSGDIVHRVFLPEREGHGHIVGDRTQDDDAAAENGADVGVAAIARFPDCQDVI